MFLSLNKCEYFVVIINDYFTLTCNYKIKFYNMYYNKSNNNDNNINNNNNDNNIYNNNKERT